MKRLDVVDVARGLALVAMAGYHLVWDLAWFGVAAPSAPFTAPMRLASHAIGAAFLALAGLSLALAHRGALRLHPFLLRLAKLGAAAALVSAASYGIAPESPIFFGILHCLFVASLLAAPLLHRPVLALALGAALVAAPWVVASPGLDPPWLAWTGLSAQAPSTLDWRPLAPWAGIVLLALGAARFAPAPPPWAARDPFSRTLAFAGRHSLAFYLIHQPLMIGAIWAALHASGASDRIAAEAYAKTCRPACVEAGGGIDACDRACSCVVRGASAAGLAGKLRGAPSAAARERIGQIVEACGAAER